MIAALASNRSVVSIPSQHEFKWYCQSNDDGRLFVTGGWYYNTAIKTAEINNRVSNTWTALSNKTYGRLEHPAVYLPAPINKILVMGGYGYDGGFMPLQSCELYDFVSNKWTTTTSMLSKRVCFTATYLASMNIIVVIEDGFPDGSAEISSVSTLQWTRSLNTMPDYRTSHTATLISNGPILITGGDNSIRTTNSFTFASNTTQTRIEPSTALLPSGLVLLTGGFTNTGLIHRSAEVYDYRLNTWRSITDMNTARALHTSNFLTTPSSSSPTVLVIGGQKELSMSSTNCELFSVNG
ncbi:hypothetical protein I4U23_022003 [Adineta vaga]|nr:hypothetical protein I4U23_022003 [Adineta vaga]